MIETVVKQSSKFPPNSKVLVFGAGFSGQHIASVARGLGAKVLCSRRNINSEGADFSYNSIDQLIPPDNIFEGVTHLISCIPPLENGKDPVLKKLANKIKSMKLKWAGYLSTTGVYGNCNGKWVFELDPPKPTQERSIRRLSCEKEWQSLGIPLKILRLPGIYGPGRSTIEAIQNKKSKMVDKPGQVFSRIHIDDIAGAIMHLIQLKDNTNCPTIINVSDNHPASNIEVMKYAANLLDQNLPPIQSFEKASKTMSPMALSFWQENRRVSNKRLCKDLGYKLIHSDYKSGLIDCLLTLKERKQN